MNDHFQQIRELCRCDERRSGALNHVLELLLVTKVTKVAEEACEAGALYRRSKGWGPTARSPPLPTRPSTRCAL
ncbi:hypothetical protein AB0F92_35145 [Kitasatospora aureofaciens]|uniref:hypothetical protein n=1 Tax=Kitasatospora aureofaciens TaxID=1894 RepID=UPI0033FDD014